MANFSADEYFLDIGYTDHSSVLVSSMIMSEHIFWKTDTSGALRNNTDKKFIIMNASTQLRIYCWLQI